MFFYHIFIDDLFQVTRYDYELLTMLAYFAGIELEVRIDIVNQMNF